VFRDYLRAHPEAARAYASTKRALAASSRSLSKRKKHFRRRETARSPCMARGCRRIAAPDEDALQSLNIRFWPIASSRCCAATASRYAQTGDSEGRSWRRAANQAHDRSQRSTRSSQARKAIAIKRRGRADWRKRVLREHSAPTEVLNRNEAGSLTQRHKLGTILRFIRFKANPHSGVSYAPTAHATYERVCAHL
jgi:hypothetical protein